MKHLKILVAALLAVFCLSVQGDDAEPLDGLGTADAIEIQAAVQSQLEALAEDDAATAFEMATPIKRLQIGSPERFLRIIKEQYNPIYRHLGTIYTQPEVLDGSVIQMVWVTGGDRHVWLAIFGMQQDENHRWKIDGCHLVETDGISI